MNPCSANLMGFQKVYYVAIDLKLCSLVGIDLSRKLSLICIVGIDLILNSNSLLFTKILFPLGVKKTFSTISPSPTNIRTVCPENLPQIQLNIFGNNISTFLVDDL